MSSSMILASGVKAVLAKSEDAYAKLGALCEWFLFLCTSLDLKCVSLGPRTYIVPLRTFKRKAPAIDRFLLKNFDFIVRSALISLGYTYNNTSWAPLIASPTTAAINPKPILRDGIAAPLDGGVAAFATLAIAAGTSAVSLGASDAEVLVVVEVSTIPRVLQSSVDLFGK
ncbi:hypothetical protein FA13DRAFT_1722877, partial [Coprinellus micaceus]